MDVVGTVGRLTRFPVKSMQGESLDHVTLRGGGVVGDRGFAIWDVATDKIASAKQPQQWRPLLDCRATTDGEEVEITLPDGRRLASTDDDVDAALSAYVGRQVRLRRATSSTAGLVYDSRWPEIEGLTLSGDHDFPVAMGTEPTSFVDVAAVHLMTTATLDRLRALGPDAVIEARRFRPNLVLDTGDVGADFLEDAWVGRRLRVGDAELTLQLATPRCVMTTVEQPGLPHDPEVLRLTARHNRHHIDGVGAFACAGVYAEVTVPGTVRVDDEATLA